MKQFKAAVREKDPQSEKIEFEIHKTKIIDGEEQIIHTQVMRAEAEPDPTQAAMLMASIGRGSSPVNKVAGMLNFFFNVFDEESSEYLETRLLDRNDSFEESDVEDILEFLMEEWSARPTQPPSGSMQSQPNGGQNSTPPTPQPTF